jgi:uridine kinase
MLCDETQPRDEESATIAPLNHGARPSYFIGIAGGTATGKSTVAGVLAKRCGDNAVVVSLDEFYCALRPGENGDDHDWDDYGAYDWDGPNGVIAALVGWKMGIGQWVPKHDFASYTRIEKAKYIPSAPVMIFEGIHMLGNPQVLKLLDLKIFVKCDVDTAFARRIQRDIRDRGYELDLIIKRWFKFVKKAFINQILPTEANATISIFNGDGQDILEHDCIRFIMCAIENRK